MAGPGTALAPISLPIEDMTRLASRLFREEIARVLDIVPMQELAIQLDLAGEVELEEYRRRPQAWDMPAFAASVHRWPMKETVAMIAQIADAVPEAAELGFHLCAIYHIDESQGQDLNVHVDFANALVANIQRRVDYIHVPTTIHYEKKDFEPLRRLKLNPDTTLFIGLIHIEDGVDGATRRIKAAAQIYPDFGIAAFCGLAQPSRAEYQQPHSVTEIFEIHRLAAEAG
jgi:hypothetical protein